MDAIPDFEDLLQIFAENEVRYLIVGGLAFIYHAKPIYTKDMDFWVEGSVENVERANRDLTAFGGPRLLTAGQPHQVLQLGLAPNRIDLMTDAGPVTFEEAWPRRIPAPYGKTDAYWIDLESLYRIKSALSHPRHQEDARVLKQVMARRADPSHRAGGPARWNDDLR